MVQKKNEKGVGKNGSKKQREKEGWKVKMRKEEEKRTKEGKQVSKVRRTS